MNTEDESLAFTSKILVCEENIDILETIKVFCNAHNLTTLKVWPENILEVLQSSIDLGGIFLYDDINGEKEGIQLGLELHRIRPELPIFLRSNSLKSVDELPEDMQKPFAGVYQLDTIDSLKDLLDIYIFSIFYPNIMVRQFHDISVEVLHSQFSNIKVISAIPYVVKDQIIYGELFSLIPLESNWCRGYMMLQTEESSVASMISLGNTLISHTGYTVDFRDVNAVLGEITNMIWGRIKAEFFTGSPDAIALRTQVPIIVNHGSHYVSFGSTEPQLCFRHEIVDMSEKALKPIVLYQKFIFNLSWSPEDFPEARQAEEDLVESGELELF